VTGNGEYCRIGRELQQAQDQPLRQGVHFNPTQICTTPENNNTPMMVQSRRWQAVNKDTGSAAATGDS